MTTPTVNPIAGPQVISERSQQSAESLAFADRASQLLQRHPWMPPDMTATLAASNESDTSISAIADSIKASLAQNWDGFTEALDDSVLHKQPTGALALARFLHAAVGPLPVKQEDLPTIQRNLQRYGYGKDLDPNGVWGADWNTAYNAWASDLRANQLAGDRPGSVSVHHAGHSVFGFLHLGEVVNTLAGAVKAFDQGAYTLVGDVAGDVVDLPHLVTGHLGQSHAANATRAWFQNLGGSNVTAEDVAKQDPLQRTTQDVLTMISLVPVAGEGSAATQVVRGAWQGGVDRAFAERTTGTIAKSFLGGLKPETIAKASAEGISRDELRRGPLNAKWMTNAPLLRQVGPVVGRLVDADGAYYKARTLLAAPYALPQVRVAGALGQRYTIGGAGLGLAADIAPHVGVNNQLTQDIHNTNVVDTIDLNLGRIIGSPNSHAFSRGLDALGFVMHGPLGSTAASTAVGDKVQTFVDQMSDALGQVGLHGAWERAVTKASGQKTSIEDLASTFGDQDRLDRFIAMKTADLAAAHHAQAQAQREGLALGSQEYRDRTGQLADEVWANPDLHAQAVKELLADPIELENRVAADVVSSDPKSYARDAIGWMNAGDHLTQIIRSGLATHMFGPDGRTVISNAQDAFDFGAGMTNPVRLSSTTRRDYVNQVSTLLTRVRRQINDARTVVGKEVQAAEASGDGRAVSSARQLQQQLENALDSGELTRFVERTKEGSVKKTQQEWDRLLKDASRLRRLVDQNTPTGSRYSLQYLVDTVGDPRAFADQLYTRINGEPRAVPSEIGSGDWMREHLNTSSGALGLGRLDTKSAQQATADVTRFRTRLAAAETPEKVDRIFEDMKNYGFREFGMTEHTLGVFTPEQLADKLDEQAHRLASEVFLTYDAPQELHDTLQRIRDLGYRPMLGSHIGHMWDSSLPPMPELNGAITFRRRVASAMGLTPEQVSSRAAGQDASIRVLRDLGRVFDDPRARIPARTTPEVIVAVLRDRKLLPSEPKVLEHVAMTATRKLHKPGILKLAEQRGIDYDQARIEYEQEMSRALQLRDISRKQWIEALTTPGDFANGAHWDGVDKVTANLFRRAALHGYGDRPGYIQGLSSLEDWARAGFSMGGHIRPAVRLAADNPLGELAQRVAELPNSLVNLRNRMRFTLSPFFDFRRVAKQNVKMSIDGVTPVLNPLKHLVDTQTFDRAHELLNRLIGDPKFEGMDDADRYLHQQSVWGLYNSRHFEAYYAWEKKQAGWTDDEIRQGIRRVFDYGSTRASGRSALERSVNTVFFPFSFEKTLLRNVGAYMIDHPQQALLLTGAISAYDDANKNQRVHEWLQDHLPVLRDMQKLNAFAHGISPGEVGGINAPLLNLFLPQKWDGGLTRDNFKRFLPVWNDFGQLLHDANEQQVIARDAAMNAADYAIHVGAPRDPFDPYRPTITPEAQTRKAVALRNQAILAWTDVLDYNLHQSSDATKYTFPNDPRLPTSVRGKVVNRTNIGALVKIWYPAYNPGAARVYAEQQAEKAQQYIDGLTDPVKRQSYGVFSKLADEVQGHIQRGDYDTATAVGVMRNFRHVAITASETDPEFYKAYNQFWRWEFGPLEAVTQTPA